MKWEKGESGNPGGRPRGYGDVRELARTHTADAIATLATIMNDLGAAPTARTSAATALLDRGWGKPEQTIAAAEKGSYADFLKQIAERCAEDVEALPEDALGT